MKKFPTTIRISRENEGSDDEYLNVIDEELVDETTPVATYKLVELGEVTVTRKYQVRGQKRRR
jgi:hypothetical protein